MGYLKNKVGHTPPNCSVSTRNLAAPSPKYALVSPSSPPGESGCVLRGAVEKCGQCSWLLRAEMQVWGRRG